MIQRIARKIRNQEEEGFTLIELMVVVLIIGILIAIAIPTFLGARQRAQNRAAQSNLRNALTSAKTAFTDVDNYTTSTNANLLAIEPSLSFGAAAATVASAANYVSISSGGFAVNGNAGGGWAAAAMSASGTCYTIQDISLNGGAGPNGGQPGTYYGKGGVCDGSAAGAQTSASFTTPALAGW